MADPTPPPNGDDDALKKFIFKGLAAVPMVLWIVYVVAAIFADHGPDKAASVNETIRLVGIGSGTALATIAGGFLGIKSDSGGLRKLVRPPKLSVAGWATLVYFATLIVAVVAWLLDGNKGTADEVIRTSLVTLFGFGIGALKAATAPES